MTLFGGRDEAVHPQQLVEQILAKLDGVKRRGKGWIARCPSHDDRTPSLSIGETVDGSLLLNCFAGCDPADVLAAIGLSWRDVLPGRRDRSPVVSPRPSSPCTLKAYADAKKLSLEFLKSLGLKDHTHYGRPAVFIPYFDRDGGDLPAKLRLTLGREESTPFHWPKGTDVLLYGLWRLNDAIRDGYLILVEGESDCHTLWQAGFPALGIPGAKAWKEEWAGHLDDIDRIYIVIEPDGGGDGVRRWLAESRIRDRAYLVRLAISGEASA
jgi:hypothetical protein